MDVKERIIKLLALGTSPNEHEAREAMVKARELMAKHKLGLSDVQPPKGSQVIRHKTEFRCSKRNKPWMIGLAKVVAKNYCCASYATRQPGKQTMSVCLTGYEEDVLICETVIAYALDCIEAWIGRTKRQGKDQYDRHQMRAFCDSYAEGFIAALEAEYTKQSDEHREFGLVLVVPKEATGYLATLARSGVRFYSGHSPRHYEEGYRDGASFSTRSRLKE